MKHVEFEQIRKLLPFYAIISFVVSTVVVISVIISINRLKSTTFKLIERDGTAIVDMATQASINGLEASYVVDNLVAERLISIGNLISRLPELNDAILRDIVAINNLYALDVLLPDGTVLFTSRRAHTLPFSTDSLRSLMMGRSSVKVFELDISGRNIFVLITPDGRNHLIAIYFDIGYLNQLKSHISIGRIIQRLGQNPMVVYIVFQDTAGIIAATRNVRTMSSIASDSFLQLALRDTGSILRRKTNFDGQQVLEFVRAIYINGNFEGLFRLGLSLKDYKSVVSAGQRQIISLAVIMGIVLLLIMAFFLFSKGYQILKIAYEELELSVEELLEKLPVGAVLITPDMKILAFNHLFKSYFPFKIEKGTGYMDVFKDDPLGINEVIKNRRPVIIENKKLSEAPQRRIFSIKTAPVITERGIAGYISIVEDVTDKIEAERAKQRLRELDLIAELAAALAHDIRNPLNSIMLMAQRLMRHSDEKIAAIGRRIKENVARIEMQMREFLQIASPLRLNRAETDIAELINDILSEWSERLSSSNVKLEVELSPAMCKIDRTRLRRAIENLIDNAVQAMPDGGQLTVRVWKENGNCVIEIADTGTGIPDELLDDIFRPYFTTKPNGTGLGLSQVERTVRAHHGRIEVNSIVGQGTTFRIYLPES